MNLGLSDQEITACFALCQSTRELDVERIRLYNKITFIEFLEFICRLLYVKFEKLDERPVEHELKPQA